MLGAFCNDRWKESNKFFGSSKNILFTLRPKLNIMCSKDRNNGSHQWLNTKSYSCPHGLGLGGTPENFRLFIPDTLEECIAKSSCLTYEPGVLLQPLASEPKGSFMSTQDENGLWSRDRFEIGCLEVWGCGGDEAVTKGLQAQSLDREIRNETIQRARQVDKAQLFNNSFNQEFLLSNTLGHRQQVADRAGEC